MTETEIVSEANNFAKTHTAKLIDDLGYAAPEIVGAVVLEFLYKKIFMVLSRDPEKWKQLEDRNIQIPELILASEIGKWWQLELRQVIGKESVLQTRCTDLLFLVYVRYSILKGTPRT